MKRYFCVVCTLWVMAVLLSSCSPQKKLERLVNKHPELVRHDTIVLVDTVVIPGVFYDTITKIETHDTVIVINNDRVRLEYIIDTLTNEIHHEVECKESQVIHEREVVTKSIIQEDLKSKWYNIVSNILPWVFFVIILTITWKRKKAAG